MQKAVAIYKDLIKKQTCKVSSIFLNLIYYIFSKKAIYSQVAFSLEAAIIGSYKNNNPLF